MSTNTEDNKEIELKNSEKLKTIKTDDGLDRVLEFQDNTYDATGILEVASDGFGFLRSDNYLTGEDDIYVNPSFIRRYKMKTGDVVYGKVRENTDNEKYGALLFIYSINDERPEQNTKRVRFENLTPVFPNKKIILEDSQSILSNRLIDMFSPIGLGQRGMIVAPPKSGKTTILKNIASAMMNNYPNLYIIILLIDERPEEVTDIKEALNADNVEVIYSTFDETPEHHRRVAEMVLERGKRLVEGHKDVVVLLDSITRLARAYNLLLPPSGKTLSGGLDPVALYPPKKFLGAARCMKEGGSLTILATALVETGSKMDDVIFEEFKGTGNMELILDRTLADRRIFPAINITKSGTRRDDLLLTEQESNFSYAIKRRINYQNLEHVEELFKMFKNTKNNKELVLKTKLTK